MEKIGYVRWAFRMGITMLLSLMSDNVFAQLGFISIDCGAKTNYTDENNISWVTDHNYIHVGETAGTGSGTSWPSYLQTLRFFPKPLNKSCYDLPVASNVPYLLRLLFFLGNYTRFNGTGATFSHTIETSGILLHINHQLEDTDSFYSSEGIYFSSGTRLYICFIKTFDTDDPFINSIELRPLRQGMYSQAEPGTLLLLQTRIDVGGNSPLRYPHDKFDRIWYTNINLYNSSSVSSVRSKGFDISENNTTNFPPPAVMQTAWVMNIDDFGLTLPTDSSYKSLLLLYFAESETLNTSESRSFYVTRTGADPSEIITLARNHSALELTFISNETNNFAFDLVKAHNSTRRPIINAYEYYTIHHTAWPTDSHDSNAIDAIKKTYAIKDWIADPCYYVPWKGLSCIINSAAIRISEIDLSRRNLTGSVPKEIGQLTALINVSLDNNHLIGQLPNLSNLTMLERLHLQNNNLSGSLPDWLFKLENLTELSLDNNNLIGQLPNLSNLTMLERLHLQNNSLSGSLPELLFKLVNLKELFIQNNNFSGNVPAELVDRESLNFKYLGGNNDLCIYKEGKCIQEINETRNNETRNNSKSVVLGISISGCLIIALALMVVGIALYWRKLRENQRLNKDSAMILSKQTKSRAFTPKEMMQATDNFKLSIGEGGCGSVYFGTLREEKEEREIAVKLLPSLKQFLHEVEVHSRAEHENLMSLLGYCFDAKHHMLIYEHMSGGSLRDSLYGPRAAHSNLNWKTRLKIALHVAQGLQFLHEGCTSKIIHMDVKTDNILLDSNMNAKLADFGISRVTSDGEATHAPMSTVKGTHGYIDPEYNRSRKVTEKSDPKVTDRSDVYSFGVVLLEIICGKPPINANPGKEEVHLIQLVTEHVRGEKIDEEIIDKRLDGKYDMISVVCVAKVALRCVSDDSRCRPSISDVVGEIKEAIIHERMKKSKEIAVE